MNMKKVMTPVLTAASLLVAVNASADIELTEGLTATGFIDMSIYAVENDTNPDTAMGLDQWEIDLMYDFGNGTTARVDLNDLGDGMVVEQAYVEVDLGSGFATKAGLFLSALGYEGPEPVDLWQYSYSATIIGYPGYSNGVALMYGTDAFSMYVSVLDGSYDADEDAESLSVEAQLKLFPVEGLTFQAGYASQDFDAVEALEDVPAAEAYDQGIINFWIEYTTGALTVAAEYNVLMEIGGVDGDGDGYLVMANYAFTDKFGLTLRTSGVSLDSGYEDTAFTISPSYAINDNLFVLLEARTDDYNEDTLDGESYAAEMIFSF